MKQQTEMVKDYLLSFSAFSSLFVSFSSAFSARNLSAYPSVSQDETDVNLKAEFTVPAE
jgi:hypothetical protein